jgi:hypothetical protein
MALKCRRSAARIDARKGPQPRYAATNTTKGNVAPRRIGRGGTSGGRTNAPFAPRRYTSPNQMASTLAMDGFTAALRRIANVWNGLTSDWADRDMSSSR